jgi:hypothetical protein
VEKKTVAEEAENRIGMLMRKMESRRMTLRQMKKRRKVGRKRMVMKMRKLRQLWAMGS